MQTGFVWYQKLAPIGTLFYSKPETAMHVTEMMICHRLLFTFIISYKQAVNSRVVIYLFTIIHRLHCFQPCLFSAPEIFIPDIYGRKMESIGGAGFWSMCDGYYSVFQKKFTPMTFVITM